LDYIPCASDVISRHLATLQHSGQTADTARPLRTQTSPPTATVRVSPRARETRNPSPRESIGRRSFGSLSSPPYAELSLLRQACSLTRGLTSGQRQRGRRRAGARSTAAHPTVTQLQLTPPAGGPTDIERCPSSIAACYPMGAVTPGVRPASCRNQAIDCEDCSFHCMCALWKSAKACAPFMMSMILRHRLRISFFFASASGLRVRS